MRSPFLISQTMTSCWDPKAATRKSVLSPASTKQYQIDQEKIIRVLSQSYKERNFVEPARKRCPGNAGNLSCPLKNLMHKHLRKRRPDENVWNNECALKFGIVACKQLACEGIVRACVLACVQRMRSGRVSLHSQHVADLSSTNLTLFLLASPLLQWAGSLKREGWHHWRLSSTPASAANDFSHSITCTASAQTSGGGPLFSPGPVWAAPKLCIHVVLSPPGEKVITCSPTLHWPCLTTDNSPFFKKLWHVWGQIDSTRGVGVMNILLPLQISLQKDPANSRDLLAISMAPTCSVTTSGTTVAKSML